MVRFPSFSCRHWGEWGLTHRLRHQIYTYTCELDIQDLSLVVNYSSFRQLSKHRCLLPSHLKSLFRVFETTSKDWQIWRRTSGTVFWRKGWKLGRYSWGISNSIRHLRMDNWSTAFLHLIVGFRFLFNPLPSRYLQINWIVHHMPSQRTRLKSALWIHWCASSSMHAY